MYRITSADKFLRLKCEPFFSTRFRRSVCDIEIGKRVSSSVIVSEMHVSPGGTSFYRHLIIHCSADSMTIEQSLPQTLECTLHPHAGGVFRLNVKTWSKEIRAVVESSSEPMAPQSPGSLWVDNVSIGSAIAYEPHTSGSQRELKLLDSTVETDAQLFAGLAAGKRCDFRTDAESRNAKPLNAHGP